MRCLPAFLFATIAVLATPSYSDNGKPAKPHTLHSPDRTIEISVHTEDRLALSIALDGRPLIAPSPVSLTLDGGEVPGQSPRVLAATDGERNEVIHPAIAEKHGAIPDHYRELSLTFENGWGLELRAYDGGVAYRFLADRSSPLTVVSEQLEISFSGNHRVWFPAEDDFLTHSERLYESLRLSDIPVGKMASLPLLVDLEQGVKIAITEADLQDYPGLYLAGTAGAALRGVFPAYPAREEQENDRTVRVTQRAPWIARTQGPRVFPWRVFVIAQEDRELIESTLVYQLAAPLAIDDPGWIQPGKVAWDWWNANNLFAVDFRAGINTETYRHYIDFAAEHGIDYVILDEGWSDPADLTAVNPDIDLQALLAHGRQRGVGIILWVVWKSLEDGFEESLDRFAEWGVAGIKVDFMQRDDQPMVNWYWKVARAAADRHLLVDFHGAYKPTGLRRAYPNVLTREGVRGLEHCKWSEHPSPEHNVTIPFIRMLAGPMDYTPGAMLNAQRDQFHPVFNRPMSLGTRCHQLAMYVVFESPLQMLADSPSNYRREPECLAFMVATPTTWDETRVLSAQVGDWVAIARRHGSDWYLGAMTDWEARELELDLGFLDAGIWKAEIFEDGPNADRNAQDYRRWERTVSAADRLTVRLAPGGGWVARLEPVP